MPVYSAPMEDIKFLLHDVFDINELTTLPGYEDATPDIVDAILGEAEKIAVNEIFPLDQSGDAEGCTFENGVVRTPKGFKEAYKTFVDGGWAALSGNPDYSGQGMPKILTFILHEFLSSTNLSFMIYPGLTYGAANAVDQYGTKELKDKYLHKLNEGAWGGTMCLTEPHCGTDLGMIKTKAVPNDDGSYKITGTKIFISSGEHDLTDNIIHLVLAKLPNAPEGTRGISLFLVPKYLPKDDGSLGPSNGVSCGSIEHKMGIKASSTCVMNFDDSEGYLVGEINKGMEAMFVMMNSERIGVGIQGLGAGEFAYQNAVSYAKDRLQGRSLSGAKYPEKAADPLIVHPDIRRMLLKMRAYNEGARAFAYWASIQIDHAYKNPDPQLRQSADDFVALVTPVIKAFFTDYGFDAANSALQVMGGHGYIKEWGIEQLVRDTRITQIYEGANGIQALDLVGRKLPESTGRMLRSFFHPIAQFLEENKDNKALEEHLFPLFKGFTKLQQATAFIAEKGLSNPDEAGAAATDYLKLFALVALGFMWARMIKISQEKLASNPDNKEFYETKIKVGRFYMQKLMPETSALFLSITSGAKALMDIEDDLF